MTSRSLPSRHLTDQRQCKEILGVGEPLGQLETGALELVGRRYDLNELLALLQRDRTFYRNSGGGVTLSGGEALVDQAGDGITIKTGANPDMMILSGWIAPCC